MANNYLGKNFTTSTNDGVVTKYLNLQGLTDFWAKAKGYIDAQDTKLFNAAKTKIDANDTAIRNYVESLTVNGVKVSSTKDETSGLGTELAVTINAGHIAVDYNGKDDDLQNQTIQTAITDVDSRLDAIQTELEEGVVSGLTVTPVHGEYGTPAASKAWVDVTNLNDATGDVTITVDDTAINAKFKEVDEDIATLTANAGVTNIAVKDVDQTGGTNKQLVQISLDGTKDPVNVAEGSLLDGYGPRRGDILITLDESALDEKLDGIDSTVADEIADRKADSVFLAGSNAEINADGKLAWKAAATQNYKDLTAISTRLDEIDENLVTQIEESGSIENFVELTVTNTATEGSNDNAVTLKIDDSKLKTYTDTNEANLKALNGLSINGKTLISATAEGTSQVTVTKTDVVLTTADIKRDDNVTTLEDQLDSYDSAIAALASATHFRGVHASFEAAKTAIGDSLDYGDIIIIGSKEYIYNADPEADGYVYNEDHWVELGDTTAETARISALEAWVDNNIISQTEINALFADAVNADSSKDMQNFTF